MERVFSSSVSRSATCSQVVEWPSGSSCCLLNFLARWLSSSSLKHRDVPVHIDRSPKKSSEPKENWQRDKRQLRPPKNRITAIITIFRVVHVMLAGCGYSGQQVHYIRLYILVIAEETGAAEPRVWASGPRPLSPRGGCFSVIQI